jgi:hypothetical protein
LVITREQLHLKDQNGDDKGKKVKAVRPTTSQQVGFRFFRYSEETNKLVRVPTEAIFDVIMHQDMYTTESKYVDVESNLFQTYSAPEELLHAGKKNNPLSDELCSPGNGNPQKSDGYQWMIIFPTIIGWEPREHLQETTISNGKHM